MPDRYIVYCEAAMREQCAREGHVPVTTDTSSSMNVGANGNNWMERRTWGVFACARCGKYVEVSGHAEPQRLRRHLRRE